MLDGGLRAGVAGASGYAGGELLRILLSHPDLSPAVLAAGGRAGEPVGSVHPNLPGLADARFADTDPAALAECDLVFLALPHGESARLAAELPSATPVVDLGADFRLADSRSWAAFYGGEHAGTWQYGLPELFRAEIAGARRIANPGCYATAATIALAPLLAAAVVDAQDIVIVAASGTSGAGRKESVDLSASEVMGSMSAYKVGGIHQHTPEVEQTLSAVAGRSASISFTPILAPMPRGIIATCTARVSGGVDQAEVDRILHAAYDAEPFVAVLPEGRWPRTASVLGSNAVQIQATVDHAAGRVIAVAVLDNLGKGAAGQAVQNANLMLGLGETAGLGADGVAP